MELSDNKVKKIVIEVLKHFQMERKVFVPKGICAEKIFYNIEGGKVKNVEFIKGCNGNLKGIAKLIEGMEINEVISLFKGIDCNGKGTSCPDQLACALEHERSN